MKKLLFAITALAFVVTLTPASFAQTQGSPHDFSDDSLGTNESCKFCHVPHNPMSQTDAPLWNHSDSTQTFTFYDGSTGSATGATLQCLSCHDGITNIDAFGGVVGTVNMETKFPGTTAVVGLDLTNNHPVSVDYTAQTGRFKDVSGNNGVKLFNNKVECASCHNPHVTVYGKFLRRNNTHSALCLTCHDK